MEGLIFFYVKKVSDRPLRNIFLLLNCPVQKFLCFFLILPVQLEVMRGEEIAT